MVLARFYIHVSVFVMCDELPYYICVCLCVSGKVMQQAFKRIEAILTFRLLKHCSTVQTTHTHTHTAPATFPYLVVKLVIEEVFPQSVRKVEDSCDDDTKRTKRDTESKRWRRLLLCHLGGESVISILHC